MTHSTNSTTHYCCNSMLAEKGGQARCCECTHHQCDDYNPMSHSEKECRGDHPILRKVPVGFMGFHQEDYKYL